MIFEIFKFAALTWANEDRWGRLPAGSEAVIGG
jgi:hypothetical protein